MLLESGCMYDRYLATRGGSRGVYLIAFLYSQMYNFWGLLISSDWRKKGLLTKQEWENAVHVWTQTYASPLKMPQNHISKIPIKSLIVNLRTWHSKHETNDMPYAYSTWAILQWPVLGVSHLFQPRNFLFPDHAKYFSFYPIISCTSNYFSLLSYFPSYFSASFSFLSYVASQSFVSYTSGALWLLYMLGITHNKVILNKISQMISCEKKIVHTVTHKYNLTS